MNGSRFVPRRKASWALALWTLFWAFWVFVLVIATIVLVAQSAGSSCVSCAYAPLLLMVVLVQVWFVGFIILAVVWALSRPSGARSGDAATASDPGTVTVPACPRCGHPREGVNRYCTSCAFDYGTASAGERPRRPWWQVALMIVGAIWLGLVAIAFVALFLVDRSWLDGEVRAIGFGTGSDPSSQCGLDDPGSSFTTSDRVSLAAWFDPPLPAGDTATITVTHDGKERRDLSGTVKVEDGHGCIAGDLGTLEPGQYRVVVRSAMETNMPPLTGEFDVRTEVAEEPSTRSAGAQARSGGGLSSSAEASTTATVRQSVYELAVGQCYDYVADDYEVSVVGCAEPHEEEVFAVLEHSAGRDEAYPGDDASDQFADQSCRAAFAPYVGRSYERSELFIFYFAPVEETWRLGDREVVCAAQLDGEQLEGSIKGSDR